MIDEAIELARKFSGDDSVPFVNGVLDSVRKELETENKRDVRLRHFPIQKVEKMRLRISSAVVAPVIASIGRSAL